MGEIWVTEQGARLSLDHQRLIIAKDETILAEAPLGQVERVMILGNIHITTPAIKRLLTRGIPLVFMGLDGRYYGRLVGQMAPHIALRRQQYLWQGHSPFTLAMAQRMVAGKVRNQRTLLQRQSNQGHEGLEEALEDLKYFEARTKRTQTLHALRGVEGSATARYFAAYRLLFR
ncbi:MAG: CRISPR-associated endonuclease Cas1, partial [Chloroflexi bacterium]|nr:CRISPR-associated endonuclease Cas1 [Chloroflexota bacterium]